MALGVPAEGVFRARTTRAAGCTYLAGPRSVRGGEFVARQVSGLGWIGYYITRLEYTGMGL